MDELTPDEDLDYSGVLLSSAMVVHAWRQAQEARRRATTAVGPEQNEAARVELLISALALATSLQAMEQEWLGATAMWSAIFDSANREPR